MISENIIYGKKTILIPFQMEIDSDLFVKLHRADKRGYMMNFCFKEMTQDQAIKYTKALIMTERIKVWTVITKDGRDSETAGFIYLSDLTSTSANISGIMISKHLKQAKKSLRFGAPSHVIDAMNSLIGACFNEFGFNRISAGLVKENILFFGIDKKIGFKQEGVLRKAFKVDDEFKDIIILSILKEEWNNGERSAESRDTKVQSAG